MSKALAKWVMAGFLAALAVGLPATAVGLPGGPKSLDVASSGGKLVLLTGGAGFIGSHVAQELLGRGDQVVIVDEMNSYYDVRMKEANLLLLQNQWPADRLRVYKGDVADRAFITEVFRIERPQWIVHLAARAGVRPSIQDPLIYVHSNVKGTTLLLELARKYDNAHFVFASSSSVYGGSSKEVFSEHDYVDGPISPYAATKKSCELIGYTYHHLYNLNVAGLRFFTVYGPRGRPDMAPFMFVDKVSRGVAIDQYGDGGSSRDYTYISDIVDGVVRALDRPKGYQIYNLGNGGGGVTLLEFIQLVQQSVGKTAEINLLPEQPGDVRRTAANVSKAGAMLGYQPKVPFKEGIQQLVQWYQSDYQKVLGTLSDTDTNVYTSPVPEYSAVSTTRVTGTNRILPYFYVSLMFVFSLGIGFVFGRRRKKEEEMQL